MKTLSKLSLASALLATVAVPGVAAAGIRFDPLPRIPFEILLYQPVDETTGIAIDSNDLLDRAGARDTMDTLRKYAAAPHARGEANVTAWMHPTGRDKGLGVKANASALVELTGNVNIGRSARADFEGGYYRGNNGWCKGYGLRSTSTGFDGAVTTITSKCQPDPLSINEWIPVFDNGEQSFTPAGFPVSVYVSYRTIFMAFPKGELNPTAAELSFDARLYVQVNAGADGAVLGQRLSLTADAYPLGWAGDTTLHGEAYLRPRGSDVCAGVNAKFTSQHVLNASFEASGIPLVGTISKSVPGIDPVNFAQAKETCVAMPTL